MLNNKPLIPLAPKDCAQCAVRDFSACHVVKGEKLEQLQGLRSKQGYFPADTHLYRQGDISPSVFNIYHGWVMLYRIDHTGRRQVLGYGLGGDFIGLQTKPHKAANHSAIALTDCSSCTFSQRQIRKIADLEPQFALSIAMKTQANYETLSQLSYKNAQSGLAFLLLDLFFRVQRCENNVQNTLHLPITQQDMGDTLALTPVHVSRTFRQLKQHGFLSFSQHRLTIHDFEGLIELAEYPVEEVPSQFASDHAKAG